MIGRGPFARARQRQKSDRSQRRHRERHRPLGERDADRSDALAFERAPRVHAERIQAAQHQAVRHHRHAAAPRQVANRMAALHYSTTIQGLVRFVELADVGNTAPVCHVGATAITSCSSYLIVFSHARARSRRYRRAMWRVAKLPPARIRPSRIRERLDHALASVQVMRRSSHISAVMIVIVALAIGGAAVTAWAAHAAPERLAKPAAPDIFSAPPPPSPPPPARYRAWARVDALKQVLAR